MPTAEYLGYAMTASGDWPSGRGTSGHYMRDTSYAPVVSLPANVTSLTWAAGTGDRLDSNASLTRWLALPSGGGRTVSSWIRRLAVPADPAPYYILDLPDATAVECAQYGHTSVGGLRLTIASEDGATTYADSGDLGLPAATASNGTWLFYRVRGPGRLKVTTVDTNIRIQGILFNSGAAAVLAEALAGLAIGGDWAVAAASDPATLRAAIFARLKASTPLAAVVGPRIFHGRVPQRSKFPAVVFHAPGRSYGHNLGGGDGTSSATVQVDCWGTSPDQCEAAATAVRLAFQGFRGAIGTVQFLGVFVDDVGETIERDPPASDDWTYRTIITLEARHRVSIPSEG